jgi:hypothetical protein
MNVNALGEKEGVPSHRGLEQLFLFEDLKVLFFNSIAYSRRSSLERALTGA